MTKLGWTLTGIAAIVVATAIYSTAAAAAKVTICHVVPPKQNITLEVGDPAVEAHLAHGDLMGACEDQSPPLRSPQ